MLLHRRRLGKDKQLYHIFYNGCDYLSMSWSKVNHVSKRGPCCLQLNAENCLIISKDCMSGGPLYKGIARGNLGARNTHNIDVSGRDLVTSLLRLRFRSGERLWLLCKRTSFSSCIRSCATRLTHWGRVTHICVSNLHHHWFRLWLVACSVQRHNLNQCWHIVNWTLRSKLQCNFSRNSDISIHEENAFKTSSAKWWPFCLGFIVFSFKSGRTRSRRILPRRKPRSKVCRRNLASGGSAARSGVYHDRDLFPSHLGASEISPWILGDRSWYIHAMELICSCLVGHVGISWCKGEVIWFWAQLCKLDARPKVSRWIQWTWELITAEK